jgi:hypothetical protein
VVGSGVGRPKVYCRRSCRQRAYESRRRSGELGLGDDELVVTRNELDDARDRLFIITTALHDARSGIDDRIDPSTLLERLIAVIDATIGTN